MHVFLKRRQETVVCMKLWDGQQQDASLVSKFWNKQVLLERDGTKVFIGLVELSCITAMVVETILYIC